MASQSFAKQFFNANFQSVMTGNTMTCPPEETISQEALLQAVCVALVARNASTYAKPNGMVESFAGGEHTTTCDGEVETTTHSAESGFLVWNPTRPDDKFPMKFSKAFDQFTQLDSSPLTPEYCGEVVRKGTGLAVPIAATPFSKHAHHAPPPSWGKGCDPVKMNDWLLVNCFNPDEVYCIPDTDIQDGATILTGTAIAENAHVAIALAQPQECGLSRTPSMSRTPSA